MLSLIPRFSPWPVPRPVLGNVPGPSALAAGTSDLGWYGEVASSELITASELADLVGLTTGVSVSGADSEPWLKFSVAGKPIYVARRSLRHSINWNSLHTSFDLVQGREIEIKGVRYKIRLLSGSANATSYASGGEWNTLMYRVSGTGPTSPPRWASYSNNQLGVSWVANTGTYTLCKDSLNGTTSVMRGGSTITNGATVPKTISNGDIGWRPVLEVV